MVHACDERVDRIWERGDSCGEIADRGGDSDDWEDVSFWEGDDVYDDPPEIAHPIRSSTVGAALLPLGLQWRVLMAANHFPSTPHLYRIDQ